jgi:hypothetical protein
LFESGTYAANSGTGDTIMSRRRLGFRNIRSPEQLETRTMLAGGGIMPFSFMGRQIFAFTPPDNGQAATALVSPAMAGRGAGHEHPFGSFGSHSADSTTSFTATLTDSEGTATGTANYSTTTTADGEVESTFSVSVTGATAATTYDVTVGDTVVGQLTADDTGTGSLVLSSNPTGTEQQLPTDFPTNIGADTAISVGTLSGALAADTDSGEGGDTDHGGCHHSSDSSSLAATLTDSDTTSSATGTVSYKVDSETGDTTLSVSVTGAAASTTLDVAINDTIIAQLTTDETGAGSVVLSSNPTSTEQALPLDFPTNLSAGSTVTVGTLTGTLASTSSTATTTSDLHFSGLRFGPLR